MKRDFHEVRASPILGCEILIVCPTLRADTQNFALNIREFQRFRTRFPEGRVVFSHPLNPKEYTHFSVNELPKPDKRWGFGKGECWIFTPATLRAAQQQMSLAL